MLRLDQSALLLNALRPPTGMEIDVAVGTTFTLDLTALLTIPVAATFDATLEQEEGADLLEMIRRYGDRTILFCQAGALSVPAQYRPAHTLIEQSVVEVGKPESGIFHPKVWIVRFSGADRLVHRVLVMSRNLTFDRAWDVIVRLDEDPIADAVIDGLGLMSFLKDLPDRAAREVSERHRRLLESLGATLGNVRFAVPPPFHSGKFVPLLARATQLPFRSEYDAALAVSPFLTADAVTAFFKPPAARKVVVSRPAALDAQATALGGVDEVYRVKDSLLDAQDDLDALATRGEEAESEPTVGSAEAPAKSDHATRGLHAKLYVQDHGDVATVWLGSANLTGGAFGANVDFLVELTGSRHEVGVKAVIHPDGRKDDLSALVESHDFSDLADVADDPEEGISETESRAYDIASRQIRISYTRDAEVPDASWTAEAVISPSEDISDDEVTARPLSFKNGDTPVVGGISRWTGMIEAEITPFVVLTVTGSSSVRSLLVKADIDGDPPNRQTAVIARAINSREDFLRYLTALLGLTGTQQYGAPAGDEGFFSGWTSTIRADRILEDLLTTVSRDPHRLDSLDRTLAVLRDDERFSDLVPPEFSLLWDVVFEARKGQLQ